MKKYWIRDDGRTNVSWGQNDLDRRIWTEITKEEYERAADEMLRRWWKAQQADS